MGLFFPKICIVIGLMLSTAACILMFLAMAAKVRSQVLPLVRTETTAWLSQFSTTL